MKLIVLFGVCLAIVVVGVVWSCLYVSGLEDKDEEDDGDNG